MGPLARRPLARRDAWRASPAAPLCAPLMPAAYHAQIARKLTEDDAHLARIAVATTDGAATTSLGQRRVTRTVPRCGYARECSSGVRGGSATIAGVSSDQRGARRAAGYGFRRFGGFERAGGTVFCESECSHSCERAFGSTFGTGSHEWETSERAPAPSSALRSLPIVKDCTCAPAKCSRTHVSVPPEPPIRTKPSRPGEAPCSGCSRSHAPVPTRRLAPARAPRARARKRSEPGHPPSRLAPQSADPTLAHGSRGVRRALAPSRLRAARRAPTRRCRPSP